MLDGVLFKGNNLAIAKVLQEYIFERICKSHFMVQKHLRERTKIFCKNLK